MDGKAFLAKVEKEPRLQTRVEKSDLPDEPGELGRSTVVIMDADGVILGGVDDDFSADTAKSLAKSIERHTGIDLS